MSECISVVLPVYAEQDNIATCLRGLDRALSGTAHEIVVVYDFDEDPTLPAIEAMPDRPASVRLVRNDLGRGAANALRAGFQAAAGDVVVTTMADLSDPPELIPRLADKVRAGADVVAGSRYATGGSQTGGPLLKRTLSRAAGWILHAFAGLGTHDATSNFRAYSKRFLDSVTVESAGGFEVALELTVKAHLAGRRVDEVPSSWVDRSAGESRFRLWTWLPHYMGWFARAAAAPAAAWLALLLLLAAALAGVEPGPDKALALARVLVPAALGATALVVARRVRGRNELVDVVHGLAWVPPAEERVVAALGLLPAVALATAISALAVLLTTSSDRRRAAGSACRERFMAHATQGTLGTVLLGVLLWLTRSALPGDTADDGLDAGWEQALGYGLTHGFQWGKDLVFTFGPLGYFNRGRYDPELFWTKVVWWELALKALVTVFYMTAFVRIRGALNRTLFYLALLLPLSGHDTFGFVGIACVALWCLERPDRKPLGLALGLVSIALMGLVKFTVFVYAGFAVALIAAVLARRRSLGAGLGLCAGYGAAVCAVWILCGQELLSLPAFVKHSYWIAKHYTAGQSLVGPVDDLVLGGVVFLLCGVTAASFVAARPWRIEKLAAAALVLAVLYFAAKSGFTRHGTNAIRFFTVSAAVPFLFFPARGPVPGPVNGAGRERGEALRNALCWTILALSFYGYHTVLEHGRTAPQRLFGDFADHVALNAAGFLDLHGLREELATERLRLAHEHALPRIRARVGAAPVDLVHNSQGVLFLNELNYRPRPIFQSYQVNSPELLALNRALYESERAPAFVIFELDTTDHRFPSLEDNEVLQVLMRDYEPVDYERGFLLWQRRPGAPRADGRTVIEERVIDFGETVEVPEVAPGETLWAELRFEDTLRGRIGTALFKTPPIRFLCCASDGRETRYRVVPGIAPGGLLLDPFLVRTEDWARWLAGETDLARVASFSIEDDHWVRRWWSPRIALRFVRRTLDRGPPAPAYVHRIRYAMFATPPDEAAGDPPPRRGRIQDVDVLAVPTPSELRYRLAPGRYRATGEFGVDPRAWRAEAARAAEPAPVLARGGPVRFRVLLRDAAGTDEDLLVRDLDPAHEPLDRRLQRFDLTLETAVPGTLVLRAEPGPAGAPSPDDAFWIHVEVADAADDEPPR